MTEQPWAGGRACCLACTAGQHNSALSLASCRSVAAGLGDRRLAARSEGRTFTPIAFTTVLFSSKFTASSSTSGRCSISFISCRAAGRGGVNGQLHMFGRRTARASSCCAPTTRCYQTKQ
jgi:hypothetical protein